MNHRFFSGVSAKIVLGLAALAATGATGGRDCAAATIKILATADGVVSNGTTLNVTGQSIVAGPTQRSAVEFNVAAYLPDYAVINFVFFEALRTITVGSGSITVNYGVYAGNGTITLSDVTAAGGIDGTYTLANVQSLLDTDTVVALNTQSVQQAFKSTGYVGVDLWRGGGSTGTSIAFDSIHDNLNPSFLKPTLIVNYTLPLPAAVWAGMATLGALAGAGRFGAWRRARAG